MNRNAYRILLAIGALLLAVGLLLPIVCPADIALIGGSSASLYVYLLHSYAGGLPLLLIAWGGALAVFAAVRLWLFRKAAAHIHVKTTALALSMSAVGITGLQCAFLWYVMAAFAERHKHPLLYPFSVATGGLCLMVLIAAAVWYVVERIRRPSAVGVLLDVFTGVLFLPAFFMTFYCFYAMVS